MRISIINFKDAVKLIHPDINPDIADVGTKMNELLTWRDNPRMLHRLIDSWGIVPDKSIVSSVDSIEWFSGEINITQDEPDVREEPVNQDESDVQEQPGDTEISVGDVIYVTTKEARFTVTSITEKRYYFQYNGVKSFCLKKNAIKV